MTTASASMSERLLDLEDIIRPIAIEETRRYLDSRELVTKAYLNERLDGTEKLLNERLGNIEKLLSERLNHLQSNLLLKLGGFMVGLFGLALALFRTWS